MDHAQFDAVMRRLKNSFITNHCERHDQLEGLLQGLRQDNQPMDCAIQAEEILHKIAGAAGSVGLYDLGNSAGLAEGVMRDQRVADSPDLKTVADALDTFLDVSFQVCDTADGSSGTRGETTPRPRFATS